MTALVRLPTFALVGAFCTLIQYAVLIALVSIVNLTATLASGIGFALSAVANYALNYRYTFHSVRPHTAAAPRFAVIAITGLVLNSLLMHAGTEWIGAHYLLAQVVATVCVLFWNFAANALWSF